MSRKQYSVEAIVRMLREALAFPVLVSLVSVAVVVIQMVYIVPVFAGMCANFGAVCDPNVDYTLIRRHR